MFQKYPKELILTIFMIGVFVLMSVLSPDRFLTVRNFQSMASQIPEFGLLAIAMAVTMLTGGIDLSVVSTANISGITAALVITRFVGPNDGTAYIVLIVIISILVALAVAFVCGAINGFLISSIGIPAILATLGTMGLFLGTGIIITSGRGVVGFPDMFTWIGNANFFHIPIHMYVFLCATLGVALLLNRTSLGKRIYMYGANPVAARFSGINIEQMLMRVYMTSGLLAGMSSIIMIARVNSAKSSYGSSYLLQAVLVAVLGGINPAGGFGTVSGVFMAIIILQMLESGLTIFEFRVCAKNIIQGSVLILIMIINYYLIRYQARGGTKKAKNQKVASGSHG